jgi:hypothetical protein
MVHLVKWEARWEDARLEESSDREGLPWRAVPVRGLAAARVLLLSGAPW